MRSDLAKRLASIARVPILNHVMIRWLIYPMLLLALAVPLRAEQITVFAAASLKTALDEAVAGFQDETGHTVVVSYAGSSVLARQIERGAPADVVITANADWMTYLADQRRLEPGTRRDLWTNRLVLVAAGATPPAMPQTLIRETNRIAMALIDAVPAGIYGKAALTHAGLWQAASPKVIQTDNVRTALRLVAIGEAGLGVVYASDAQAEPRVAVVAEFATDSHPPILYPGAIVAGQNSAAAGAFLAFLAAQSSRFAQHGFIPLADHDP